VEREAALLAHYAPSTLERPEHLQRLSALIAHTDDGRSASPSQLGFASKNDDIRRLSLTDLPSDFGVKQPLEGQLKGNDDGRLVADLRSPHFLSTGFALPLPKW